MDRIVAKIDVTKVKKELLFAGKNGAKYLDMVLFLKPDKFGNDGYIKQNRPRESQEDFPFLGSFKCYDARSGGGTQAKTTAPQPEDGTPF